MHAHLLDELSEKKFAVDFPERVRIRWVLQH
jgi:hypothetical protein